MSEVLNRGVDADSVLRSEAFQEAVEAIRDRIQAEWAQSPFKDVDGREKLWCMHRLLDNLIANLQSYVADGKMLSDDLTKINAASPWNLPDWRKHLI